MTAYRFSHFIKAFALILFLIGTINIYAQFAGGSGTQNDPYLIQTAAQLDSVRNHLDCSFRQIADIDLGIAPYNQGVGWVSIRQTVAPFEGFQGRYEGGGYNISNLYINNTDSTGAGLFAETFDASLDSIIILNATITSNTFVGSLVGYDKDSSITNCHAIDCSVNGVSLVGGLIGENNFIWEGFYYQSPVINCSSSGSVSGTDYVGGLIGRIHDVYVLNNHSSSVIQGEPSGSYLGGLIGRSSLSRIIQCYATGDVIQGYSNHVGGLVGGQTVYQISYCYATGNVSGHYGVGGLIGDTSGGSSISNCYATGNVSGYYIVGGLIGFSHDNVAKCYSTGSVSGSNFTGGLVGEGFSGNVINSYWDIQISGQTTSAGGEGRITVEMTYPYADNTYVGWNFDYTWQEDTTGTINEGYPYFSDNDLSMICETPTFNPSPGNYEESVEVNIYCPTEGSELRYTIDGTDPTVYSLYWNGPILLESTTTIKARAFRMDWCSSDVAIATYTITVANNDEIFPSPVLSCSASPNPFSDKADIKFCLPKENKVNLCIYNSKGQLVRTLTDSQFSKGEHTLTWDGKSDSGRQVSNGIYLYKLQGTDFSITQKLMLLK